MQYSLIVMLVIASELAAGILLVLFKSDVSHKMLTRFGRYYAVGRSLVGFTIDRSRNILLTAGEHNIQSRNTFCV